MAEEGKSRLGRGLAALIGEVGDEMGNLERKGMERAPAETGVTAWADAIPTVRILCRFMSVYGGLSLLRAKNTRANS